MVSTLKFYGRNSELETLITRWSLASDVAKPSPQIVVIKAERGLGKTRLALEFYRWLRAHVDGWLTKYYWPNALEIVAKNLEVNPNPYNCTFEVPIPYLWWGLRAGDPGTENGVAGDAIATYDRHLAPHLVALLVRAHMKDRVWEVFEAWKEVGLDLASSALQVDNILSVGKALMKTVKILIGTTYDAAVDEAMDLSIGRAAAVLSDMEKVFNPGTLTYAKTPGVIFLDDAQFAKEDAALPTFIERLMYTAVIQRWPVLILVTHWKAELSLDLTESEISFAGILRHARGGSPTQSGPAAGLPGGYLTTDNFAEIDLTPIADLSGALRDKLPGLTEEQSAAILGHMGGNPRFLEQVIEFLSENENFFEDFDPSGHLTSEGLEQTLEETKSQEITRVVLRRLRKAPVDIQEAICLASLQGVRFVNDFVDALAEARIGKAVREQLSKGEDPYCMLIGTKAATEQQIGQFAERIFYQVAQQRRQTLTSLGGESALQTTFKETIAARVDDPDYPKTASTESLALIYGMAANLFERSSDPSERYLAQKALGEIGMLDLSRYAFESAAASYERLLAIEPHSDSLGERRNRIATWEALATIYENLKWPAKAGRAFRQIFWEASYCVPGGLDIFPRSTDKYAAIEHFSRWKQEHSDWSPEIYVWVVSKMVYSLLSLSELARGRPELSIVDGDNLLGGMSFLANTGRRSDENIENDLAPVPKHLLQATFLLERANALGGVLGDGEVARTHFRLLEDLARRADRGDDLPSAKGFLLRAFQINKDLGDKLAQITTLSNLGMVAARQRDPVASDKYLEQARSEVETILAENSFLVDLAVDDKETEDSQEVLRKLRIIKQFAANVYGNLAGNALQSGRLTQAKEGYLRSLSIRREIDDKENMTTDLRNLGKIAHIEGDLASACAFWGGCVEVYRELERRDAGKLLMRGWSEAIEGMLDGMRASGCMPERSVAIPSDGSTQ